MADVSKAQKLAAARKRLKEYQKFQSKQKNVRNGDEDSAEATQNANLALVSSENATPAESMTSSTHSAFDHVPAAVQQNTFSSHESEQPTETNASFFNKALFQQSPTDTNHVLSDYFDRISPNANVQETFAVLPDGKRDVGVSENVGYADPFEQTQDTVLVSPNEPNAYVESVNTTSADPEPPTQPTENSPKAGCPDVDRTTSECALPDNVDAQNSLSNTESLRQLSSQLNSLIGSTDAVVAHVNGPVHELEHRNQELAGLLTAEHTRSDELSLQVRQYRTRIAQLESETTLMRTEHEAQLSRQVGPLQEQLDYHTKACGILVGERTELQLELGQSQATVKQRVAECQELQGRLKASRHRVSELEREVTGLKAAQDTVDRHAGEHSREFERLRLEYQLLREQCDEATEESSELRAKLTVKATECAALQADVQEKHGQLALAQLRVQQLTTNAGDTGQTDSQIEILSQQRIHLEQQVAELTQAVRAVGQERDQASQQYQQYVQQLNGQIQSLAERLATRSAEHEALADREQSLVKHVGELETRLQQWQTAEHQSRSATGDDLDRLQAALSAVETEKVELAAKHREAVAQRQSVETELADKSARIEELEGQVELLQDQPDATKLLATMESDKVAAARAVQQNQQLKEQLQELHDGFIKMSNSKLELTEKLQSQEHIARKLSDKLVESRSAVEHLHSVIATKDAQLTETQVHATALQKQILHQNQLADRLRHYEAQDHASDYIQQDLQETKRTVLQLTAENVSLRTEIENCKRDVAYSKVAEDNEAIRKILVETADGAADEHEQHVDEQQIREAKQIVLMRAKLTELEVLNETLQTQLKAMNKNLDESEDGARGEAHSAKETAMVQLEARFTKTMVEVANLTEEKHRLEHLVLQLQGETETIGEYVALYQCQRAVLNEKALEKDEQLKRLAQDREDMKHKLEQLNGLIQRLVLENGIVSKEVLLSLHHAGCRVETDVAEGKQPPAVNGDTHDNNNVDGTAGQIIALLSEIKTSNLVQPTDSIQNFHPCPLCSGQLITV